MSYRIVYFGTPDYAVPALEQLASDERFDVVLAVTQPDRPAGRGHKLTPPPVKVAAELLDIPVYQPESLRSPEMRMPLVEAAADLFVVAAYGMIFGEKTLAIPNIGCVNLHASILPDYRGASPISAAILEGRASTGVSLMVMERGLDAGPVIAVESIPIKPDATTGSLTVELATVGAHLVRDFLADFAAGKIIPKPQDTEAASFVRPLTKADGWIDWSKPAVEIDRHVRAMWPWPRAWTEIDGLMLQIHQSDVVEDVSAIVGPVGSVGESQRFPVVKCGVGYLCLLRVQFPGKQVMDARVALASGQLRTGLVLNGAAPERTPMVSRPNGESATSV
jgi:methionyl-tRNA formyltransferase